MPGARSLVNLTPGSRSRVQVLHYSTRIADDDPSPAALDAQIIAADNHRLLAIVLFEHQLAVSNKQLNGPRTLRVLSSVGVDVGGSRRRWRRIRSTPRRERQRNLHCLFGGRVEADAGPVRHG